MSQQPPVQPPDKPTHGPTNPPGSQAAAGGPPAQPGPGSSSTQPMAAAPGSPLAPAPGAPTVGPPGTQTTAMPTASMPAAGMAADPPPPNAWKRATSTTGRRVALAVSAGVLVCLLLLAMGVAGVAILRHHDRVNLLGNRQDRHSFGQPGPGDGSGNGLRNGHGLRNGKGPGANGNGQNPPPMPRMPGGRAQGPGLLGGGLGGGFGDVLGGAALHGNVTAKVGGSVQALVFHRGEITAVSATSITLKSTDAFTGSYAITSGTRSMGRAAVKGGQAFVLARASDKVAITMLATPAKAGAAPSS